MAQNGMLPSSSLVTLSTPGRLTSAAAKSFERLLKAAKAKGILTGTDHLLQAYRDYAGQVATFEKNYTKTYTQYAPGKTDARIWKGVTWYRKKGGVAAAVPGTSNHGWGATVDWQNLGGYDSTKWKAFAKLAAEHGWSNAEGRSVNEPWHWTYNAANDKHINDGVQDKTITLETPMLKHKTSTRTTSQTLAKGTWTSIKVNNEGHVSSACSQADIFTVVAQFVVKDLAVGAPIQIRAYMTDYDANGENGKRVKNLAIVETVGNAGSSHVTAVWSGQGLKKDPAKGSRRLRFEALVGSSGVDITSLTVDADMWNNQ